VPVTEKEIVLFSQASQLSPPLGVITVARGATMLNTASLTSNKARLALLLARTKHWVELILDGMDHACVPSFVVPEEINIHVVPLSIEYSNLTVLEKVLGSQVMFTGWLQLYTWPPLGAVSKGLHLHGNY
jgi:hypothetical protein